MRAQLTFDLSDADDAAKFKDVANDYASNLRLAMHGFSQDVLRKYRKYGIDLNEIEFPDATEGDGRRMYSEAEQKIAQCLVEHLEKQFYVYLQDRELSLE